MKNGWEDWKDKRRWIKRNNRGQFMKGNFHTNKKHRRNISLAQKGRIVLEETKIKISNKLKGLKFSKKRKRNISIGTKKANYKWAKGCKHNIVPISNCRECMNNRLREWRAKKKAELI